MSAFSLTSEPLYHDEEYAVHVTRDTLAHTAILSVSSGGHARITLGMGLTTYRAMREPGVFAVKVAKAVAVQVEASARALPDREDSDA